MFINVTSIWIVFHRCSLLFIDVLCRSLIIVASHWLYLFCLSICVEFHRCSYFLFCFHCFYCVFICFRTFSSIFNDFQIPGRQPDIPKRHPEDAQGTQEAGGSLGGNMCLSHCVFQRKMREQPFRADWSDPTLTICDIYCQKWAGVEAGQPRRNIHHPYKPPGPLQLHKGRCLRVQQLLGSMRPS